MDFQRLFLFIIFSFSALLLWDGWQKYQHPVQNQIAIENTAVKKQATPALVLTATSNNVDKNAEAVTIPSGKKILVHTDNFLVEINTIGGDIQRVELLRHKDAIDKNKSFVLLEQSNSQNYIAQTGLIGDGLPNHKSLFTSPFDNYTMAEGVENLTVKLEANPSVSKTLTFHRGSYLIDVGYEITNSGTIPINASAYYQLVRNDGAPEGDSKLVPTYTGPAIYTDKEKFQKVEFSSIEKNKTDYPKVSNSGWVAILQHYFVSAWLPPEKINREYYTKALGNKQYSIGTILPIGLVESGHKGSISSSLYVGPATSKLDAIAPGLGLTVDYGWLTIIATPLFWLLAQIQGWVNNWGGAIIVLTVLIKLAFFPLSAASYRSMARMKLVAPKLEKIKQQFGDDREKLNRAMMDLYKVEKINPLGGCLPMLVQIPVFISLYWAILASVELRHAPFIGWITDLSAADPYYVLPAIMGISMLVQSKLSPAPPDPLQAKLMQLMPIIFSVVFFFFPAGLVLYSVVNNILSIAQQWYITRKQEIELKVAAKP
jgi:YidC/Oxa1 family membrane protein insertase